MKFIYTTDPETKKILEQTLPLFQTKEFEHSTFWCFLNEGDLQFNKQSDDLKFTMSDTLLLKTSADTVEAFLMWR